MHIRLFHLRLVRHLARVADNNNISDIWAFLFHFLIMFLDLGLFNPDNDKDACGVGFVGELSKKPTRSCVKDALEMLVRM